MTTHNDRKHRKSFFSIKAKIALLCTCSILIAVFVTFIYLVNVSKDAITGSTEVTMQNLAASYNSSLSDAIHQISMSADFMMSSSAISAFVESGGTEDAQEVENLAAMFLGSNTAREDISITDADGNVLYSSNNGLIGTNLSGEAYFGNMAESGLNSLGDVFISDSSGEACITFAVPLRTDIQMTGMGEGTISADTPLPAAGSAPVSGTVPEPDNQEKPVTEFTGAIVASVKVSEFTGNLSAIEVGNYETGYAFLLDSAGKILYYPDESLIGQAFDIREINDIVSKVQSGTVPESRIITYTYDDVAKYAGYSVNADNGWIMFVAADRAEVLA
jgi:methyl-accepting chemotaxis protein